MARDFDGALPHLQLIADAAGFSDPLERDGRRGLLARWSGAGPGVGPTDVRPAVREVFRGRCGPLFADLAEALDAGALPHHSFTVLCVYPWVGMLGDPRRTPQAMRVLDRCRIRSGVVLEVAQRPRGGLLVPARVGRGAARPRARPDRDRPARHRRRRAVLGDDGRRPGRPALGLGLRRDHRRAGRGPPALQRPARRHRERPAGRAAGGGCRAMAEGRARHRMRVQGVVQGVGFRPFVYALARRLGLAGSVANDSSGVIIEVEGEPTALRDFRARLRTRVAAAGRRSPRSASRRSPVRGGTEFVISELGVRSRSDADLPGHRRL